MPMVVPATDESIDVVVGAAPLHKKVGSARGGFDTYGRSLGCTGLGTVRGRTALALAAAGVSRRKIQTRCTRPVPVWWAAG